ncbi:MAG: carboxypeptidase [[Eubacterium] sulci]|jgi:hypothetical protein|nr:carboxypeptidase [[Eubacterium] sulci]MBF1161930.1 carboxypeptidase [[Eubacterium] sulci]DAS46737.1 MAG TPA: hypothetical protein [Caudoviricetes sp.]
MIIEDKNLISAVIPRGTEKACVMKVIKTTALLGAGTPKDPLRYLYQYWDFEGKLLAQHDSCNSNVRKEG